MHALIYDCSTSVFNKSHASARRLLVSSSFVGFLAVLASVNAKTLSGRYLPQYDEKV